MAQRKIGYDKDQTIGVELSMRILATGLAFLFVIFVLGERAYAEAGDPVGSVERMRGVADASSEGARRQLETGSEIFLHDEITTGSDTRLLIAMKDGTELTLGDDSLIVIDDFLFDEEGGIGREVFSVVSGVFRAVSGGITALDEGEMTVRTPVATLGIRGTEFWGEQRADRLHVAMLAGTAVIVENEAGRVVLTEPLFVTLVTAPDAAPSEPVRLTDEQLRAALETVAF